MISKSVLDKMKAAALVCTCAVGCTKTRAIADALEGGVDASTTTAADAEALLDASDDAAIDGSAIDDDVPIDASIDAPFGTVACAIHGAHAKLPDGGVDLAALGVKPAPASTGGLNTIGIGAVKPGADPCPPCGMGGGFARPGGGTIGAPKGIVSMGSVSVTGAAVDPGQLARFAAQRKPKVRACYQASLNSDPTITGALVVTVKVSADGHAETATAEAHGLPDSLVRCVTGGFRSIDNSELGGRTVRLPYKLALQE